ncbi:ferric reductase like transmembrane component-domain-containing protein [Aspergillus avenaceus]|uniref:Ferric reductase like transmembrane component-domain-containing protein n=1 Tax=Aspergillus avenaceus TaxID=36643 RepID=A0A5N6TG81_ASPAV|nr:ferric reductase like transmembrane component-domain-containing protein [Aspergillus avenaceus]
MPQWPNPSRSTSKFKKVRRPPSEDCNADMYLPVLFLSLAGLVHAGWGGLSASTLDQYCFYSIYKPLSSLTWSGTSVTPECSNSAEVASIYASAKLLCSDEELSAGIELWKSYCQGLYSPLDLDSVSGNITATQIDPSQSSGPLASPVLLSCFYYQISYRSYLASDTALPKSTRISWSVMGYWGSILLIGMLHRLWSSARNVVADAERKQQLPDKESLRDRFSYYLKLYFTVPALGSRCLGCTIPDRLEALVVAGFWVMCLILNFAFHDIFTPNTVMPTAAQQAWKYAAQRTSMFAYSCLPWIWLFAGRNNIFIWATGWSFRTFNVFHRHVSRLAAVCAFAHAISYTVLDTLYSPYYEEGLRVMWFKFGITGAAMMGLLCGLSMPCIRRKCYEAFLVGHILFAVVLLVAVFQHTSIFGTKYNSYLWPVVAIWCSDRLLRVVRLIYCNIRVSGGSLRKTTALATYSKDANVIRLDVQTGGWRKDEQSISYTMTEGKGEKSPARQVVTEISEGAGDGDSLVFWVRPYDGWTNRLRRQCLRMGSGEDCYRAMLPIYIEGPYGHTLPLHHYGTLLMIVGGTGISTAVPYVHEYVSRARGLESEGRALRLIFVWACRGHGLMEQLCRRELADALVEGVTVDFYCRPDIRSTVSETAASAQVVKHSMAVLTCGSADMSNEVRRSVHGVLRKGFKGIEHFEETYSW